MLGLRLWGFRRSGELARNWSTADHACERREEGGGERKGGVGDSPHKVAEKSIHLV